MCNKRNSTTIDIWNKNIKVDYCIASLVNRLNVDAGVKTLGSCCGHGKYPMTIVAYNKHFDVNYDFISGIIIPRDKKFYKKDKDGFYFIPEVLSLNPCSVKAREKMHTGELFAEMKALCLKYLRDNDISHKSVSDIIFSMHTVTYELFTSLYEVVVKKKSDKLK